MVSSTFFGNLYDPFARYDEMRMENEEKRDPIIEYIEISAKFLERIHNQLSDHLQKMDEILSILDTHKVHTYDNHPTKP